jgi:hypothetical protein
LVISTDESVSTGSDKSVSYIAQKKWKNNQMLPIF